MLLESSKSENLGIYSIVRSRNDGSVQRAFYFQINFFDSPPKIISEQQKSALLPLLGNPDTKFVDVDGEIYAVNQIKGITRQIEPLRYAIGAITTDDFVSAKTLAKRLGAEIEVFLPRYGVIENTKLERKK